MATTIEQIGYDLINSVRGGLLSTTEPISLEQIYFLIENTRAKLIREDLAKKRTLNPDIVQNLCVDLEIGDSSTCPCLISGCTILQSVQEIPEAIETHYRNLIISAGPIDIKKARFNLVDSHRARFYGQNKYTSSIPIVFLYNKKLYFLYKGNTYDMMENISLEIVLERPSEASKFSCAGQICYNPSTTKFPIAAWMIPILKQMIIQNDLKIETNSPTDKSGNLSPDYNPQVEPKGN